MQFKQQGVMQEIYEGQNVHDLVNKLHLRNVFYNIGREFVFLILNYLHVCSNVETAIPKFN